MRPCGRATTAARYSQPLQRAVRSVWAVLLTLAGLSGCGAPEAPWALSVSHQSLEAPYQVKELHAGGHPLRSSTSPRLLASLDSMLFFVTSDDGHGEELWKTDGTPGGIHDGQGHPPQPQRWDGVSVEDGLARGAGGLHRRGRPARLRGVVERWDARRHGAAHRHQPRRGPWRLAGGRADGARQAAPTSLERPPPPARALCGRPTAPWRGLAPSRASVSRRLRAF